MNRNLKILGVSQGQGILLLPLKRYLIGNIEPRGCFHTPHEEQWKINFGEIPFVRKKEQLNNYHQANIIIGSPNCGASSILSYSRKKTLGKPKEDESIKLFLETVLEVSPDIFVMENLPKLLDFIPIPEWEAMFPGYKILYHNCPVSDYGNSQLSRVRLMLLGIKLDCRIATFNQFTRVFKVKQLKNTRQLLLNKRLKYEGLIGSGNIREEPEHKVCMYDYRDTNKTKLTLEQIRQLWVGDFNQCYKWPINSPRMKTLPGVYRNNENKCPMTARKQDRQFRPDGIIMSPAELAVIQGLPIKFKIYHETNKLKYWINKGRVTVTKGPSYELGLWFKKCLLRL